MRRREFLRAGATGAAAVALRQRLALAAPKPSNAAVLPQRAYKDDVKLSIIGFPGLALSKMKDEKEIATLVAESVERGCNYFDVAPRYGDAEVKLGPALAPFRKKVFLACKTALRNRDGAKMEFERSLERLKADRFDLYQLHVLKDVEKDVDAVFAKGGVMDYLLEQKKAGRIRYLGFSAHTEEAALAALERGVFDSILFPVNFGSYMKGKFGPRVVEDAKKRGVAVCAIKTFARQWWPKGDKTRGEWRLWYQPLHDRAEADLSLRFTMAQGAVSAVPAADARIHRLAMDVAGGVKPVGADELATLRALADTLNPVFTQHRAP
ncbi:MAG: aldo/keto reductase [Candidatus Brocadiae bacterium]|nr:aldo/keto reductase [Candidatus Brocadiia bacterium]